MLRIRTSMLTPDEKEDAIADRMGRGGKKTWYKYSEERLLKEYHKAAHVTCKPAITAFVECSKAQGLMVIFKCREQNLAMGDCLTAHTSDFEGYKNAKIAQWIKDGVLDPLDAGGNSVQPAAPKS